MEYQLDVCLVPRLGWHSSRGVFQMLGMRSAKRLSTSAFSPQPPFTLWASHQGTRDLAAWAGGRIPGIWMKTLLVHKQVRRLQE